ncbi:unnamed protein product, partial [Medioppia subpectinata]
EESCVERKINKKIQTEIKKDKRNSRRQLKLLLLGTGESGKSTFIKQMRIIHEKDFSDDEKRAYIRVIHHNILSAMQSIVNAMKLLDIHYKSSVCQLYSQLILSVDFELMFVLDKHIVDAIKELWTDFGVQQCFSRRNEYQLTDSAKYYISDIDRITCSEYLPTQQDILRARAPTNGINEYTFVYESIIFRMVDVGGQRSERRKWIHCFESVTSIIFICAISEFDQILRDGSNDNRLQESKALFKTIVTCEWFHNSSVILFFNKYDLFEEKICSATHLVDFFGEYEGPKRDVISGRQFVMNMFFDLIPDSCLKHSAKYYISDIDRITCSEYLPTQQDILRARAPTNGINEYTFVYESIIFRMVDVGGQRSERRKWIHCFESVTSIIFICAISEFDQILRDGSNDNRLQESKALFKTIVTCEWFHNSSVILFFNKYDLFEEKICSATHLVDFFNEYEGPKRDVISGRQFVMNMFFDLIPDSCLKRIIYSHLTCATNTENIRLVFNAVKDTIFELLLRKEIQIF